MNKKPFLIIVLLLTVVSFLAGSRLAQKGEGKKILGSQPATPTPEVNKEGSSKSYSFTPKKKSAKPEVKFFVMSFCPFGNQAEAGLEPVYQLLKDKVEWLPRYIFSPITQDTVDRCKGNCAYRVADDNAKKQCQQAIEQKQLPQGMTVENCVQAYFPYKTQEDCIQKECRTLKIGAYDSLHGQQEFNQDIREICAYNLGNLEKWWKFVSMVNEKCSSTNADTCWRLLAEQAGFDAEKIASCEKSQANSLAKKEVEETQKYNVSGSPTVYINDTLYEGGRSPEDYKKAICLAFEEPPTECQTVLGKESAPSSGGCN